MNIFELESFNLADAVKFHDRLNHRLWDHSEHLHPQVKDRLMMIAQDFQEFLGVSNLDIKDITVSGSNAAYNYTDHSDIDLHLVVDIPNTAHSDILRELFNAKKYQYNDQHNIKIGGADVELYVQPADQPHHSQGIYSLLRNAWIQVPRRKRARIDDTCVQAKFEDLAARIDDAVSAGDADRLRTLKHKIKTLRQTGLAQQGEFGCDNLVFKMLRARGYIGRLSDAINHARDQELSLAERDRPIAPVIYGFVTESPDGVDPSTKMFLEAEPSDDEQTVRDFIEFTADRLGITDMPHIELHTDPAWSTENHSFGRYTPETHTLEVSLANRHVMDILRTTAHELAHCRQNQDQQLPDEAGETGSPWENQAHAVAGVIMRDYADRNPAMFESSGYIPTEAERDDPRFEMALSVDVQPGATGLNANRMSLRTDAQGRPQMLRADGRVNMVEYRMPQPSRGPNSNKDLNKPLGPETPPEMPAGTVKVDVSDVYDWYKLGQHISNMKGLGKHDFGAGPPSAILSFGDEDLEHQYIQALKRTGLTTTDIDPVDPNQPADMPRQKTDPTYKVDEAFDQPYPMTWERAEFGMDALARLPDGSNLSIMFNDEYDHDGNEVTQVEFWRNNSQDVTGEGDAQKIFATVLSAIQQFIQDEHPKRIVFSADKEPGPSRANLYKRLVDRFARPMGYQVDTSEAGTSTHFVLTRRFGLRENFADGRNPQDKGDSKRYGVPTKASVSTLRRVAKQGGRKGQLAHWMANMKAGRARANRKNESEVHINELFQAGKQNWEWARLGRDEVSAFFKAGGRDYLWQAFASSGNPKKWELQFRLIRKPDVDPDNLDLFGTTGTGNSAEVMSTAVDITRAFLAQYGLDNVEEITFNAKEDSRIGLYAKMIKRLLPNWELYSKKDPYDGMVFTLTDRRAYDKPDNKIDEVRINNQSGVGAVPHNADVDYFGLQVAMRPSMFLKLALPMDPHDPEERKAVEFCKGELNERGIGAPFLNVSVPEAWEQGDFSQEARVKGHDGRHRCYAVLEKEGDDAIEMHIFIAHTRRRDITDEMIENLRNGILNQLGQFVRGPIFGEAK